MPRFHFHVYDRDGASPDEEGVELAGIEAARACAIDGIRSIVSDAARSGSVDLSGRVDIVDEDGEVLEAVRFDEAVELQSAGLGR
jgi:hypothetical protein